MIEKTGQFKHILVAFDGSASSRRALDAGIGLAEALRAKISIVTVEEYLPRFAGDIGEVKEEQERQDEFAGTVQKEAADLVKQRGMDFYRADILAGHVEQAIISHAGAIQCDLIVMGRSGRSGVWGNFLGTTVDKVTRHAPCTVLIVS